LLLKSLGEEIDELLHGEREASARGINYVHNPWRRRPGRQHPD
jgi:hypothetical protein